MKEPTLFACSGRDSIAQLLFFMIVVGAGVTLPIPALAWQLGGVSTGASYLAVALIVWLGLRSSIEVTPSETVITRKWLFIPYRRYSAPFINDVRYNGDWGDPEGSSGVVVKLGSREISLGSVKTRHHLFCSLTPLKVKSLGI